MSETKLCYLAGERLIFYVFLYLKIFITFPLLTIIISTGAKEFLNDTAVVDNFENSSIMNVRNVLG